jgi:hypothetical protein
LLGERDVCSIVGREVRPELKHPTKQRLMAVPEERQIQIVLDGIRGTRRGQLSRQDASAKSCCDLDVTERRRIKVGLGCLQNFFNLARAVRLQEVLDKC